MRATISGLSGSGSAFVANGRRFAFVRGAAVSSTPGTCATGASTSAKRGPLPPFTGVCSLSAHSGVCSKRALNLSNADIIGHLANDGVMHMQNDGMVGGFEPLHRRSEQIAGNSLDDVLGEGSAPCASAAAVFGPATGQNRVVPEAHGGIAVSVCNEPHGRIGDAATARQRDEKEFHAAERAAL